MCEDPIHINNNMTQHESQELQVPEEEQSFAPEEINKSDGPLSYNPEKMTQGPVNAITVLTLLDKLVNMLDTVQENQHKMEVRQEDMGGVVRGIQADMSKLSKNHNHTSNTVSKLLDRSRKVSVTMKEVREKMERQAGQVKKLEANHAHLLKRNNFKVLIFQDESEIPSSVFVKEPAPYPRDNQEVGGDDSSLAPVAMDTNRSAEEEEGEGLHTIDLSSDEDVGLEAGLEEEGEELHDLETMDKSRADKIKRSSLKKVDSIKKAFTHLGSKMVSQEQREKIKKSFHHQQKPPGEKKTSPFKVSPLTFSIRKRGGSTSSQPAGGDPEASVQTRESPGSEAQVELPPLGSGEPELPFTTVHSQLAPPPPAGEAHHHGDAPEKPATPNMADDIPACFAPEADVSMATETLPQEVMSETLPQEVMSETLPQEVMSEGVSQEYALSETLPQGEELPLAPPPEEEEEEEPHLAPPPPEEEEEMEGGMKGGMEGGMKGEEKEKEVSA